MRKTTWLMSLYCKLSLSKSRGSGVRRESAFRSGIIEPLEKRQLLSAAAIPIGSESRVNTSTTENVSAPAVAMDSSGDYVVAWQSTGQESGIFAQRFNAVGTAQGLRL